MSVVTKLQDLLLLDVAPLSLGKSYDDSYIVSMSVVLLLLRMLLLL